MRKSSSARYDPLDPCAVTLTWPGLGYASRQDRELWLVMLEENLNDGYSGWCLEVEQDQYDRVTHVKILFSCAEDAMMFRLRDA